MNPQIGQKAVQKRAVQGVVSKVSLVPGLDLMITMKMIDDQHREGVVVVILQELIDERKDVQMLAPPEVDILMMKRCLVHPDAPNRQEYPECLGRHAQMMMRCLVSRDDQGRQEYLERLGRHAQMMMTRMMVNFPDLLDDQRLQKI